MVYASWGLFLGGCAARGACVSWSAECTHFEVNRIPPSRGRCCCKGVFCRRWLSRKLAALVGAMSLPCGVACGRHHQQPTTHTHTHHRTQRMDGDIMLTCRMVSVVVGRVCRGGSDQGRDWPLDRSARSVEKHCCCRSEPFGFVVNDAAVPPCRISSQQYLSVTAVFNRVLMYVTLCSACLPARFVFWLGRPAGWLAGWLSGCPSGGLQIRLDRAERLREVDVFAVPRGEGGAHPRAHGHLPARGGGAAN